MVYDPDPRDKISTKNCKKKFFALKPKTQSRKRKIIKNVLITKKFINFFSTKKREKKERKNVITKC